MAHVKRKPVTADTPVGVSATQRGRGRPSKPIDLELVQKLAMIQCTQEEIAWALNMTPAHFGELKNGQPEISALIEKGKGEGRMSLRRKQFALAMQGDKTMLIWLGKQTLGQRDTMRNEVTGIDGAEAVIRVVYETGDGHVSGA